MDTFDVVVVGGGPGGSSTSTFLADGGLRVALFERERFPRFHVGESLMPATMLLLEELGAKAAIEERGFQLKYGATFIDEDNNAATQTFYFLPGQPWPNYSYQVPRADFDTVLLEHATKRGVTVFQPATVEGTEFDAGGVTLTVSGENGPFSVRAKMLVDATGRDALLATPEGLLDAMIARSRGVSENLAGAVRITPVHRVANFSYHNSPVVGDRFVAVGDAIAFVDPIFSGGVYIALRTGQLAAAAILQAFRAGDFSARRFAAYERRVRVRGRPQRALRRQLGDDAVARARRAADPLRARAHQHLDAPPRGAAGRIQAGMVERVAGRRGAGAAPSEASR